jgi:hypothetical protein
MSEIARQRVQDDEAVPVAVVNDEKTQEMPMGIPEVISAEETVPVRSSLDKLLRHEMLRHQSARNDSDR